MRVKLLTAGLLAAAGLLAGSASSQAGDVFRLAIPAGDDTPTMKLGEVDASADTLDVWRGGFHGGFRGGFGGFRGGFGGFRGGFGGYRGFYGGGYRGFWGGGYRGFYGGGYGYRPWYGSWYGYQPYYYGGYGYAGYPLYYGSYYGGCYPIAGISPDTATTTFSLQLGSTALRAQLQPGPSAAVQAAPSGSAPYPAPSNSAPPAPNAGTYEYDGGPRAPIPLPKGEPATPRTDPVPMNTQPAVPLEGRSVSIPAVVRTTPKYTYPAYGEQPRSTPITSGQAKR